MKKRPNILWLCADQQRYDTIRALAELPAVAVKYFAFGEM